MNEPAGGDVPTNVQAEDGWSAVIEDMEATATKYRERGWTALELHPGDSVLVDSDRRTGLDVVLPGSEFEELESLVDDRQFRDVEVFRAEGNELVYVLVVEIAPESETAVFVPAYYDPSQAAEKLESIREAGAVRLFCRRLNDDAVRFVHDDPTPFLPDPVE
ncbi:hypothetical protein PM076_15940 [Halorubrum ezzemoulense]|jgi:hypothetical protein|uniref:Uncharacterized protein n=2 Tax=Halorubrum ezzemoulense TaxID=337243 RepID=A0A238YAV7_HALEZ|nr:MULTISPECIES: hypothetical protein [Halorubrum]MDB2225855.1 hypothetical protein [Halorubrum ezzemoulense]MDB2239342.1 hypothetical protein [Halorubrum ezzemoulense]MDB2242765.1 hypothetical protein [Halorubrum ezzemoulense]MDB2246218.1 hypothetical protein [Halorubrum ezzemoulense]MDB2249302.1 hypothetical protein [Halorubrum ezzemoulense]